MAVVWGWGEYIKPPSWIAGVVRGDSAGATPAQLFLLDRSLLNCWRQCLLDSQFLSPFASSPTTLGPTITFIYLFCECDLYMWLANIFSNLWFHFYSLTMLGHAQGCSRVAISGAWWTKHCWRSHPSLQHAVWAQPLKYLFGPSSPKYFEEWMLIITFFYLFPLLPFFCFPSVPEIESRASHSLCFTADPQL